MDGRQRGGKRGVRNKEEGRRGRKGRQVTELNTDGEREQGGEKKRKEGRLEGILNSEIWKKERKKKEGRMKEEE